MIGFYKHEDLNKNVWILEVISKKNDKEFYSLQYVPNGKCPIRHDTYAESLQIDKSPDDDLSYCPYWRKITCHEAAAIIGNMSKQKTEYKHRQSEDIKKWSKELAEVLNKVSGISAYAYDGVVRIDTARGEYGITKDVNGKLECDRLGYPDPY